MAVAVAPKTISNTDIVRMYFPRSPRCIWRLSTATPRGTVSIGAHYDPRTLLQLGIQLARRPAGIARVGAETRACELLADRSPQRRETAAGVHACEHTHGFRRRAARTDQQRQVI